jgi:hypothetical protein
LVIADQIKKQKNPVILSDTGLSFNQSAPPLGGEIVVCYPVEQFQIHHKNTLIQIDSRKWKEKQSKRK